VLFASFSRRFFTSVSTRSVNVDELIMFSQVFVRADVMQLIVYFVTREPENGN
jgi:hypothetical protein